MAWKDIAQIGGDSGFIFSLNFDTDGITVIGVRAVNNYFRPIEVFATRAATGVVLSTTVAVGQTAELALNKPKQFAYGTENDDWGVSFAVR